MINLDEFQVVNLQDTGERKRGPYICVSETGITFGIGTINALERPAFVQILANRPSKTIVLRSCEQSDSSAFPFVQENKKHKVRYVRTKSATLVSLLNEFSGRHASKNEQYRVRGELDLQNHCLVFDMTKAYNPKEKQ